MNNERLKRQIETETYSEGGALYWTKVKRPVPLDCFKDAGLPMPKGQEAAVEAHHAAVFARITPRQYTAEDMSEMRAAFGAGAQVVNVFTGQKINL